MLFTFVGGAGHYEPLAPIARAALERGHVVAFACRPAMWRLPEADGFEAWPTGTDAPEPAVIGPLVPLDEAREDLVLRYGFAGDTAAHRARDVRALCASWRPDVVVSDEVDFGAMVAAERLAVPHATVLVLPAGSFARPELLVEPLDQRRAEQGLPPDPDLAMVRGDLVIAPFPPSFRDPAHPLAATTLAIRPAALAPVAEWSAGPWPDEVRGLPLVWFTLGTIFNRESGDLFARVVAGLRERPFRVVVTVGRSIDLTVLGVQPANVRVERFVPLAALLPQCDAVVCHGGSGTVVGALAHGRPLVLLPMGADQPHNARRCEALGVGIALDAATAGSSAIAAAVSRVVEGPSYRGQAERLGVEARRLPGPLAAVDRLERLATRA